MSACEACECFCDEHDWRRGVWCVCEQTWVCACDFAIGLCVRLAQKRLHFSRKGEAQKHVHPRLQPAMSAHLHMHARVRMHARLPVPTFDLVLRVEGEVVVLDLAADERGGLLLHQHTHQRLRRLLAKVVVAQVQVWAGTRHRR